MTVTHGMDTVAGKQAGDQIRQGSDQIIEIAQRLDAILMSFDWTGIDADRVRASWQDVERPALDVTAQPERPGEFHREEAGHPGGDRARRLEGVIRAGEVGRQLEERRRRAREDLRREPRAGGGREDQRVSGGSLLGERPHRVSQPAQAGPGMRAGALGGHRVEAGAEVGHRGFGEESEQVVSIAHPLVERGRAHTDALGDGSHREAVDAVRLDELASGSDDLFERRAVGCGHRSPWTWSVIRV